MKGVLRGLLGIVRGHRRGQSLVEFALALPVVSMIFMGIIDTGFVLYGHVQVAAAAAEGARAASLHFGDLGASRTTNELNRLVAVKKAIYDGTTYSYLPTPRTGRSAMGYLKVNSTTNFNMGANAGNQVDVLVDYPNRNLSNPTGKGEEIVVTVKYRQPVMFDFLPGASGGLMAISSSARIKLQ